MCLQTNLYIFILFIYLLHNTHSNQIKIWGPGLKPHKITMPARYFFIQSTNPNNSNSLTETTPVFNIVINGISQQQKPCRIWSNTLDRKDGSIIVRYKLYEPCISLSINVKHENEHVGSSPYLIKDLSYSDDCKCPIKMGDFLESWECGPIPDRIKMDLEDFPTVNWDNLRDKLINQFDQPHSVSICHYVIKSNQVHRKCYGQYVGFKMFMDSILLSLTRKTTLPDLEFFVNLGDWPLVQSQMPYPIFSWCGSTKRRDITMPTYDITESTLENMGKVMLDMLSVQGNVLYPWKERKAQVFWRGRDSNQHRLDLIDISREYPELFNVSLTNFFFFKDKVEEYGPKAEHVSFFRFFDYKYQLNIDGTVAAYRFPYLLAGGSLVFKQDSNYYEHFYHKLEPNIHYIPIKRDLSDLIEKLNWARENDEKAEQIAKNAQKFANDNLLPQNIFCYYTQLLNEFSKRITSKIRVLEGMELVEHKEQKCDCKINNNIKEEL